MDKQAFEQMRRRQQAQEAAMADLGRPEETRGGEQSAATARFDATAARGFDGDAMNQVQAAAARMAARRAPAEQGDRGDEDMRDLTRGATASGGQDTWRPTPGGSAGGRRPTQAVGEEQLRKAMETLKRYREGKARLEMRIIKNEEYWRLRHWEWMQDAGNPWDEKPRSAWLFNTVMMKHADLVEAYPEPNLLAREMSDEDEAKILSDIIPVVMDMNDFDRTWSQACLEKVKGGTGVYGIYWDKKKHGGLGDITIKSVDPLNLFWEPGVTDIQDSQNFFHAQLVDNNLLESAYPQTRGQLKSTPYRISEYIHDDHIDTTDKSLVIDWYYHTYTDGGEKRLQYCKFVNDIVLYASEDDTEPVVGPDGQPGPSIAETGWYAHGEYPFVFDPMYRVEGSPCGFGVIDICRSPQEQIDLLGQAVMKNALMGATPRFLVRNDGDINEKEFADWTKPIVHAQNLSDTSMRVIESTPLNGNFMNAVTAKVQEMRDTSGNSDVLNGGVPAGVTSASGIAALQQSAGRSSRAVITASYWAYKDVIHQVIELIRQFYQTPRFFRVLGDNGAQRYVMYSNARIREQEVAGMSGVIGLRKPEFDIDVQPQKQTAYTKLAQNDLAQSFFQIGVFNPQLVDQSLMMLDMMDFKGKDKLVSRLSEMQTLEQQLQMWQQMAVSLASKYEPGMAAGMMQQAGMGGPAIPAGEPARNQALEEASGGEAAEHPFVEKARAQAEAATEG